MYYEDIKWWREQDYEMDYEQDGIEAHGCISATVDGVEYTALFSGHMEGPSVEIDELYDAEKQEA
jgi:hypothetical protein